MSGKRTPAAPARSTESSANGSGLSGSSGHLLRRVHGKTNEIGRGLFLRDLEARLDRIFVAAVLLPVLRVGIPVTGLAAIQRLVQQRDAAGAQEVHRLVTHLALVGLDGAAVLDLDLIGLDD